MKTFQKLLSALNLKLNLRILQLKIYIKRKISLLLFLAQHSVNNKMVPGCKDKSDTIYPSNYPVCNDQHMRNCTNNQTCMHENLFCDGHVQCEDGSDENEDFCQRCPR
jgi:hypothetical protein